MAATVPATLSINLTSFSSTRPGFVSPSECNKHASGTYTGDNGQQVPFSVTVVCNNGSMSTKLHRVK